MKKLIAISALLGLMAAPSLTARADGPLCYDKGVIDTDTTWSGSVVIKGQTVVKKGATLTIEPGTTVRFEWSDEDGDDIGDGELNVEGRIVARGTKDDMITFTSAKDKPAQKDWTFLMISVNKGSLVEYCIFEYAFSGVQVHYSTAVIRNNIMRHNFEGVRFSTTDVVIEHNEFTGNTYGIRYESRGSRTDVTKNIFKDNEYAFFPVQKCSDSVKIAGNTIMSDNYNVKMGYGQREDLDYRGNWWGTTDSAEIESGFFDGRKDGSLGKVVYEPALTAPEPDCGMM